MFDEQSKPQGGAAPVVDMFEGAESGAAPKPRMPLTPPAPPAPQGPAIPPSGSNAPVAHDVGPRSSGFGIVKIFLVIMLVIVLIAAAGYAAWRIMSQEPAGDGPVKSVDNNAVVGEDDSEKTNDGEEKGREVKTNDDEEPGQDVKEETRSTSLFDSDGDGLTNAEELEAGTLSSDPDTDDDGLGDREEVKVYGTDPRDEDTDGDTFLDGQEVASGYNPNGPGKLFNVPSAE